MKKPEIEQLRFIGDHCLEFQGYCEALILRVNGKEKYIMHRYYERHITLYKLRSSIKNNRLMYQNSKLNDKNCNDYDEKDNKNRISSFTPHKILSSISGIHEVIKFENLKDMLKEFPGGNIECWIELEKASFIIPKKFIKKCRGHLSGNFWNSTKDPPEDDQFNHYNKFNFISKNKPNTFILY